MKPGRSRGFTLLEVLVALAVVAIALGAGLRAAGALTDNAERLADGQAQEAQAPQFRFVGLPALRKMPTRWLDPRVSAQVVGGTTLVLGPDAILPAQRIVLRLDDRRLELATDGLGPFAVAAPQTAP